MSRRHGSKKLNINVNASGYLLMHSEQTKGAGALEQVNLKSPEKAVNYLKACVNYMDKMSPEQLKHMRKMLEGQPRREATRYHEDIFDMMIEVCTVEAVRRRVVECT